MALTDEQIRKIMQKEITAKTILVDILSAEITKKNYINDGWELVSETPLNNKVKLTFRKVK